MDDGGVVANEQLPRPTGEALGRSSQLAASVPHSLWVWPPLVIGLIALGVTGVGPGFAVVVAPMIVASMVSVALHEGLDRRPALAVLVGVVVGGAVWAGLRAQGQQWGVIPAKRAPSCAIEWTQNWLGKSTVHSGRGSVQGLPSGAKARMVITSKGRTALFKSVPVDQSGSARVDMSVDLPPPADEVKLWVEVSGSSGPILRCMP